jgi:hypothetical protein
MHSTIQHSQCANLPIPIDVLITATSSLLEPDHATQSMHPALYRSIKLAQRRGDVCKPSAITATLLVPPAFVSLVTQPIRLDIGVEIIVNRACGRR